eukprot:9277671-Alexandrium_andersonii.AAC.1
MQVFPRGMLSTQLQEAASKRARMRAPSTGASECARAQHLELDMQLALKGLVQSAYSDQRVR